MKKTGVLLRYHEIALKGGKRGWFEERLAVNACRLVARELGLSEHIPFEKLNGRILLKIEWSNSVREALGRVFGLTGFSPVVECPSDLDIIHDRVLSELRETYANRSLPRTFRVETRRSAKILGQTSMDIDRALGAAIQAAFPSLAVNLTEPELTVGVEIHAEKTFLWTQKIDGPGGLPAGTNGRALALLSGGLDSPVAAIHAMRRGASTPFLHFYGTPFVGSEVLEKVEDLARIINRHSPEPQPLHIVPFGKIQEKIALATNPKLRTVIYRRMMIRIASRLAERLEALALITGESLGQVASQTLENIGTIDSVATLPILRPLITYDKDEIIEQAKRWGTYETAIRPGVDCCTLFADRHPSIRTTLAMAEEEESKFPVNGYVEEALNAIETRR